MLELGDVGQEEQGRIEAQMRAAASRHTFESALTEASVMLSGISRGAGVVVTTSRPCTFATSSSCASTPAAPWWC